MNTLELVKSSIEVVDVGLVMLFVMSFKQLAAKDRLQSRVSVLEIR